MNNSSDASSYCKSCKKRAKCTELCAPVEALLNQFDVRGENKGSLPDAFVAQSKEGDIPRPTKTKKELILELYFIDRRTQTEIFRLVGCDKGYVSRIINKTKRTIK